MLSSNKDLPPGAKKGRVYRLKPRHKSGIVIAQRVGQSLSVACRITQRRRESRKPNFAGHECIGRKQSRGWTAHTRRTFWRLLEQYSELWLTMITISLPSRTNANQFEQMFGGAQRFLYEKNISALGCAETTNPHFHVAAGHCYDAHLHKELDDYLKRLWRRVYHSEMPSKALLWEPSDKPLECIPKYLTEREKKGRLTKGKAPWLQCQPYFKTRLPKLEKDYVLLSESEAQQILDPRFKLTFGAYSELENLRQRRSITSIS